MPARIAIPPPSYKEAITGTASAAPQVAPYCSSVKWMLPFAAPRENFKNSPLMRLPDNLLVKIMKSTSSDSDTLALRHTSRTFMRLFSENQPFSELWDDGHAMKEGHVWTRPNKKYNGQGIASFCSTCNVVDKTGEEVLQNMDLLYCSGCRADHTEMHFSRIQRQEIDEERVCIGRESRLRLCSHLSLSWSQVRVMASSGRDHRFGCNHASHDGLSCPGKKCMLDSFPMASVEMDDEDNYLIHLVNRSHIPFNKGPEGEKPFWAHVLLAISDSLGAADKQQMLPSAKFEGCDVMRVFDPNHCNCLNWDVRPEEQVTATNACFKWHLANTDCGNWRGENMPEVDEYGGESSIAAVDLPTDRCFGKRHGFTKRMNGRIVNIDLLQCPDDSNMLVLQQSIIIKVQDPTDPGWEELMDGDMVFLQSDKKMRGKTWCDEKKCAVNYLKRSNRSLRVLEHMIQHEYASRDQRNNNPTTENEEHIDYGTDYTTDDSDEEAEVSDIDVRYVDVDDIDDAEAEIGAIENNQDVLEAENESSLIKDNQSVTTTADNCSIFSYEDPAAFPSDDESTTSFEDDFTDADTDCSNDDVLILSDDEENFCDNVITQNSSHAVNDGVANIDSSGFHQAVRPQDSNSTAHTNNNADGSGNKNSVNAIISSYRTIAAPWDFRALSTQFRLYYPDPESAALAHIRALWN